MLSPGDLLVGKYKIESVIGQGGFGQVYLAYDEAMDRHVAIKELSGRTADTSPDQWREYQQRFAKEAQVISHLSHPNVVTTYALESDAAGSLYLVTEYVEGGSLREILKDGPLDIGRAVSIALDIAQAIEAIYRYDIVHRDIKPSNILIGSDGHAKLTDFGVAQVGRETLRTQETTEHPGTPAYKSPEQATSRGYLDQRSDLYALGLVLYEMLTGALYVRNRVPPHHLNPQTPLALSRVVLKALEEELARRYQTAAALCQDLEHVRDQSTLGQMGILLQGISSRRLLAVGGALCALVIIVGLYRIGSALQGLSLPASAPLTPVAASVPETDLALLPASEGVRSALLLASAGNGSPLAAQAEGASLVSEALALEVEGPHRAEGDLPTSISIGERQTWVFDREGAAHSVVFRVKAGNAYLVSTSNLAIGVDTRLEVVADERVLVNDDIAPGTLASQVSFTALEDGTAQATVYNQDQYGSGRTYDLSVIMLEATPTSTPAAAPEPTVLPTQTTAFGQPTLSTGSPTPRPTFTLRPTWTPALQTTGTPTVSTTRTPTITPSPTWTRRPTWTLVPTWTRTPTLTTTPTITLTPTATGTPTQTLTPSATETVAPTSTPTPTVTPVGPTPLPTANPSLPPPTE